jgi:S-adenosylmethionine:tRNA ribosyltransferase-isomerase
VRLEDIDYDLPEELIAQHPIEPRDSARLFVSLGDQVEHRRVRDLVDYFGEGDLFVVNDTKVLPARVMLERKTGGKVEVLLLESLDAARETWEALVRPGRKVKPGEKLLDAAGRAFVEVEGRSEAGDTFVVRLLRGDSASARLAALDEVGVMPLPPYITATLEDRDRYQTVYAREARSAAAPTAGLHFTPELIELLRARGVEFATVELVVGLDTFKPIEAENPLEHVIHTEYYNVPAETWEAVRRAQRVVAVGTTSTRALESVATRGELHGRTDLFVTPGYEWKAVDVMMTNFHMPRTSLLLMIQSFIGDRWRDLYAEAVNQHYRFLSFGDAMLLARADQAGG